MHQVIEEEDKDILKVIFNKKSVLVWCVTVLPVGGATWRTADSSRHNPSGPGGWGSDPR